MNNMKKLLFAIILLVGCTLQAADVAWTDSLPAAKEAAAKENKDIFVLFTGSDWCPACKALKTNVLESDRFKTEVSAKYVLVAIDFKKQADAIPDAAKIAYVELVMEFDVGVIPTILIMDNKGMVFGVVSGGVEVGDILQKLLAAQEAKKQRDETFAVAAKASGKERALLYHAALARLHKDAKVFSGISAYGYENIFAEIIAGDPLNAEGLRIGYDYKKSVIRAKECLSAQNFPSAIAALDDFLKKYPENEWFKQSTMVAKAQLHAFAGEHATSEKILRETIAINPDTEQGKLAKAMLDALAKQEKSVDKDIIQIR